jgi:hypothetical protein
MNYYFKTSLSIGVFPSVQLIYRDKNDSSRGELSSAQLDKNLISLKLDSNSYGMDLISNVGLFSTLGLEWRICTQPKMLK